MKSNIFIQLALIIIGLFGSNDAKLGSSRRDSKEQEEKQVRTRNFFSPQERYATLKSLSFRSETQRSAIRIFASDFHLLVFPTPRNYSCFVMFYNSASKTCPTCAAATSTFEYVVQAYYAQRKAAESPETLFFVIVEFNMDQPNSKVKLDLDPYSPNLYFFSETKTKKFNPFMAYDIQDYSETEEVTANALVSWIRDVSEVYINLRKMPSEQIISNGMFIFLSLLVGFVVSCWRHGKLDFNYMCETIYGLNFKYIIVSIVIWLVAGIMYNQIRGAPLGMYGQDGSLYLISPSHRDQYVCETVLVMAIYGLIAYAVIKLIELKETQLELKEYTPEIINGLTKAGYCFLGSFVALIYLVKTKN